MNGGLEEVLMRAVDEVSDAVKPWLAPAVESEVERQLSADSASTPVGPPKRATGTGSGLQLTLSACGFGPKTRTRIAVEAMTAIDDALREHLQGLVRAQISRQRPISERAQRVYSGHIGNVMYRGHGQHPSIQFSARSEMLPPDVCA